MPEFDLKTLVKLGVLPGLAIYLVWTLTIEQRADTRATREMLAAHTDVTMSAISERNAQYGAQQSQIAIMVNLLRQTCVNTAGSREQQLACLR